MTRTITTAAELDALPVGSVVLTVRDTVWRRMDDSEGGYRFESPEVKGRHQAATFECVGDLPVTVLHDPSAPAAPSATREDVAWVAESVAQDHRVEKILRPDDEVRHVYLGCSCGLGPISYLSHAAHVAYMTLDSLLARFTITPRTYR